MNQLKHNFLELIAYTLKLDVQDRFLEIFIMIICKHILVPSAQSIHDPLALHEH